MLRSPFQGINNLCFPFKNIGMLSMSEHIRFVFFHEWNSDRSIYFHRFSINLKYLFFVSFNLNFNNSALTNLNRFIHPYLALPQLKYRSNPYHFNHPIAMRLIYKFSAFIPFPKIRRSPSPTIDIQDNDIFNFRVIDDISITFQT